MWDVLLMTALMIIGIILMFIILLQRGRGGGLAGAFGGLGGQSAFGTKAGDVFTKITVGLAAVWVLLAGLSGFALRAGSEQLYSNPDEEPALTSDADDPSLATDTTPLTTDEPPLTTDEPSITTDEPTVTTDEPAADSSDEPEPMDEGETKDAAEDADAKADTEPSISTPAASDADAEETKPEAASESAEKKAEPKEEPKPAENP